MDYHRDRFADYSLLISDDKGHLVALLPANRENDTIISHGGLTYGGFVVGDDMKTPLMLEVFECVFDHLVKGGFAHFVYKTMPYIYHRVPAEEDRYTLFLCHAQFVRRGVLTVVTNQERLPFQERRARGIRKAQARGLAVRESENFAAFWEILTDILKKMHNTSPVHSLQEISLLHSRFPSNIRLFACFRREEMLAGTVIYESERVAHVQYIASNEQGRAAGALDSLFNFLLGKVYRQKPFFDFGTSDEDNGTYLNKGLIDQKEGFGARAVVHDHYSIRLTDWKPGLFRQVMESRVEKS